MKVVGISGPSGIGKTTLIRRLIPELRRRKLKVAVIKHCPHGFDLEPEGKDTWRFAQAGAEGVAMLSRDRLAVAYRGRSGQDWEALARRCFPGIDIVLVEGGRNLRGLRTIEIVPVPRSAAARSRKRGRVALLVPAVRGPFRVARADVQALALFLETVLPDEEDAVPIPRRRRS
jgi:molybdopterin-guanine dinucleotide biosynthesis protein MobB